MSRRIDALLFRVRFFYVRAKLDLDDTAALQGLPQPFRMTACMEE